MAPPALKGMTIDEFLDWADREPDVKYELVHGQPRAMAPVSQPHSRLAGRLALAIGRHLRPPCEILMDTAIEREDRNDRFYEADLAVTCSPHRSGQQSTPNPILIVEILSESTAEHDRGTKVPDYMRIPSVQEILLVDSRAPRVQLWRRDGTRWIVEDFADTATLPLASVGVDLPVPVLYEGVAF